MRTALARLLRAEGLAVETFASAQEYLAIVGERRPGCLVLDVHLGAMSGFELHDRLLSSGAATPTVFITAHDETSSSELTRRVGADGFLRKPFDSDDFLAVVRRRLREGSAASEG